MPRIYWIWYIWYFKYVKVDFNVKNYFYETFATCYAQNSPQIKYAQSLLIFSPFDISNMSMSILMSKAIFIKHVPAVRPELELLGPKIKSVQNLLKLSLIAISNMKISILMLKIIFMKHLLPVRHKLVPKLKLLRVHCKLAHLIFQIYRIWI